MNIGFEEGAKELEDEILTNIEEEQMQIRDDARSKLKEEEDEEVQIVDGHDQELVVMQSIQSIEDAWRNMSIKTEGVEVEKTEEEMKQDKPKGDKESQQ
jgi:hypothetical protein